MYEKKTSWSVELNSKQMSNDDGTRFQATIRDLISPMMGWEAMHKDDKLPEQCTHPLDEKVSIVNSLRVIEWGRVEEDWLDLTAEGLGLWRNQKKLVWNSSCSWLAGDRRWKE